MIGNKAINKRVLRRSSQLQIWAARLRRVAETSPESRLRSATDQGVRLPLWVLTGAAAVLLVSAGVYAFSNVFSRFAFYDDEGFMMVSVQGFLEGNPLYDSVLTGYGPCYYFWQWIIHTAFCLPVTHDVTGAFCVLHWVAAAVILAFAGYRTTRSPLLGFFVFIQAVFHLRGLSNEPGHPQELVAVLLALAALVSARGMRSRRPFWLLGGIGAAAAFTKINIGMFYLGALVLALACQSPRFQSRRAWFWGLLGLGSLFPFLLMRPHLGEQWARDFSVRTCAAILAVGCVSFVFAGERKIAFVHWCQAAFGYATLSAVFVGILLLSGTSISAMMDCLVTSPAKLAAGLSFPAGVQRSLLSGIAAVGTASMLIVFRAHFTSARLVLVGLKGAYGILGTLWLVDGTRQQLGYLLPWVWLVAVPTHRKLIQGPVDLFPRSFLGLLAVWEGLQAYPAAGTQAVLATFLLVLVYSLCLHDAITNLETEPWLNRQLGGLSVRTKLLFKGMVLASLVYLFAGKWCAPQPYWRVYSSLEPLGLPGSQWLRLPAQQADTYRTLVRYLRSECDAFVTIPGFNSLYFWTGKKPPTYFNIAELILMSDGHQAQVVEALRKATRPLIVLNEQKVPFMLSTALTHEGPLTRFVRDECGEIKRWDTLHILAPRARVSQSMGAPVHPLPQPLPDEANSRYTGRPDADGRLAEDPA